MSLQERLNSKEANKLRYLLAINVDQIIKSNLNNIEIYCFSYYERGMPMDLE